MRLYALGAQSIWIDESYTAEAARRILETGIPLLKSGFVYWKGLTHTYLAASMQYLFGKNTDALRLPAAFFGIAMIPLSYWSGIVFFKKRAIGLIAALFITFGLFDIGWSRQIRMYTQLQFFYLFSVALFYLSLKQQKINPVRYIAIFLTTMVTVMTHLLGIFLLPSYILILWCRGVRLSAKKKAIIISILSTFVLSLILSCYPLAKRVSEALSCMVFHVHDYSAFLIFHHGFVLLGVLAGGYYAIRKKNQNTKVLLAMFFSVFAVTSLNGSIGMRYVFFIMPLFYLIASYGFFNMFSQRKKIPVRALMLIAVFLLTFRNSFVFTPKSDYFLENDILSEDPKLDYTPQPAFKKAYRFLEDKSHKDDLFIVAHTAVHEFYMPDTNYLWLGFNFGNDPSAPNHAISEFDGYFVDIYTGKGIIDDPDILKDLMEKRHGYIIFDYFSADDRLSSDFLGYIRKNADLVFDDQANSKMPWTRLWVYRF